MQCRNYCGPIQLLLVLACTNVLAMDHARVESGAEAAIQRYGLSGSGVTIVILDRGIDYTHPDFIKPDGTTRIKGILDMSTQFNYCNGTVPAPVEYTEAQINAALDQTGPALPTRDAVGHGTVTAGIAAGNGSAFASGKYRGIAPEADLLIVKYTSEGAPARGGEPAEASFVGCFNDALDWVDEKIDEIGQPAVALANFGTQFGPMDGSSAMSRKIGEVFPPDNPGRIWVEGAGDEGDKDNHAGGTYENATATVIPFTIAAAGTYRATLWYDGAVPAAITVVLDNGTTVGPVGPGEVLNENGIYSQQYLPGQEFDPWTSTSGDRAALIDIGNYTGDGEIQIRALSAGSGRFDAYGGFTNNFYFTDLLVEGRLADIATTPAAIVLGAYVNKNSYIDADGVTRDVSNEGSADEIWDGSSGGPSRDGRAPVVDVMAPGHNVIAAYGSVNTTFGASRGNLVQDGGGYYGRQGAVSGAAPILLGGVALLLELDPTLTTNGLRAILQSTARADSHTGTVPNNAWGSGKLDLLAAAREVASQAGYAGMLDFDAAQIAADEADGSVDVSVSRSGGDTGSASVDYSVSGGTAADGTDYTLASGTLDWADGESGARTFSIAIADDGDDENDETIELALSGVMGATLGTVTTATVTIADNDSAPPPPTPMPPVSGGGGGGGAVSWLLLALLAGARQRARKWCKGTLNFPRRRGRAAWHPGNIRHPRSISPATTRLPSTRPRRCRAGRSW